MDKNARSKAKKEQQLGMKLGTANHQLRKMLMFSLVQKLKLDTCYHCGKPIDSIEDFSIEHKTPWLDSENPAELFFDIENISFSHLACNIRASRCPHQKYFSKEARLEADRKAGREYMRRVYTTEKRRTKYKKTGH